MRTNRVILIIGGRGSGKTVLGKNLLNTVLRSHPEMYGLVVDTFDHPAYRSGYTRITPGLISRIKPPASPAPAPPGSEPVNTRPVPGVPQSYPAEPTNVIAPNAGARNAPRYRVFGSNTHDIMVNIEEYAMNACILFEDASKYISGQVSDEERRFILDSKQKNLDLVFMFHGFGFVPPTLYRLVDAIYLLRTNDTPETRKTLIPCYTQVKQAYDKIQASPEKYPREAILLV